MLSKLRPDLAPAQAETPVTSNTTEDVVNDILKYKQLVDAGVLTQEEFAAKKQQLLGL